MKQTRHLINSFTNSINDIPINQIELIKVNKSVVGYNGDPLTIDTELSTFDKNALYYDNSALFVFVSSFTDLNDISSIISDYYADVYKGLSGRVEAYVNYNNNWYELVVLLNVSVVTVHINGIVDSPSEEADSLYYCVESNLYRLDNKDIIIGTALTQKSLQYGGMAKSFYFKNGQWIEIRVQIAPDEAEMSYTVSDNIEEDIVIGGIYYLIKGQLYRCVHGNIWIDCNPMTAGEKANDATNSNAIVNGSMQPIYNRDIIYLECYPYDTKTHTRFVKNRYGETVEEHYALNKVLFDTFDLSTITSDDAHEHCMLIRDKWYYYAPAKELFKWTPNGELPELIQPWVLTGKNTQRIFYSPDQGGITLNDNKDNAYIEVPRGKNLTLTTEALSSTTPLWLYHPARESWVEYKVIVTESNPNMLWANNSLNDELIQALVEQDAFVLNISNDLGWELYKFDYTKFFVKYDFVGEYGDEDGYGIYERQFQFYRNMMHRYYDVNKINRIDHADITFIHQHPLIAVDTPENGKIYYDPVKDTYYVTQIVPPEDVIISEIESVVNDGIVDDSGNSIPVIDKQYYNKEGLPLVFDGETYFEFLELKTDNKFIQHRVMYL